MSSLTGKKLILHVGPHKTGTSSIQATLRSSREALAEHGVDYIPTTLGPKPDSNHGHHNLAYHLINDPRLRADLGGWEEALSYMRETDAKCFIISSEVFTLANQAQVDKLRDMLRGMQVTIAVYLRQHLSQVNSALRMTLAKWAPMQSAAFCERQWYGDTRLFPSYRHRIEPWINAFGIDALQFHLFEAAKTDLTAPLLAETGIQIDPDILTHQRLNHARCTAHLELNMGMSLALNGVMDPDLYDQEIAIPLSKVVRATPQPVEPTRITPEKLQADLVPIIKDDLNWLAGIAPPLPDSYHNLSQPIDRALIPLPDSLSSVVAAQMLDAAISRIDNRLRLARSGVITADLASLKGRLAALTETRTAWRKKRAD
jgi:hypothetical protein